MKKTLILSVFALSVKFSPAQVVLNELYVEPGNGYHEFFELYNTSPGPLPENMDNYTLITYYEEQGNKTGFYILDLPNQSVLPKRYYVGAAANPFTIQSQPNLTADFNWNSMPAGGSISKWERNGSSYSSIPVPANLNDLFVRKNGNGAVYHAFVYKNGTLVNAFIGGTNAMAIPSYLKAMPPLFVDMSGASPDFTIDFNTIPDNSVEYTTMSVGTNNGYFREFDGKCGAWLKSDAPGQHTPGQTNGSASNQLGELSVSAVISVYASDPTKSLLTYTIVNGPAAAFPVTVEVYLDRGMPDSLDAADTLIDIRIINNAPSGPQDIVMPGSNITAIIVIKSPAGCYDAVLIVDQYLTTLPVQLTSFGGTLNRNNMVTLSWSVTGNEQVKKFEVEKSINDGAFITAATIAATEKMSNAGYEYYENKGNDDKVMYRLRLTDKENKAIYSKTLVFRNNTDVVDGLKIFGNPVNDKLTFSSVSSFNTLAAVSVYDATGKIVLLRKLSCPEGNNIISLSLSSSMVPGMYVVELNDGRSRKTAKFMKQ